MRLLLVHEGFLPIRKFEETYKIPAENEFKDSLKCFDLTELPSPIQGKKMPANERREWFKTAKQYFDNYDYILFADADWFKTAARSKKAETTLGTIFQANEFPTPIAYIPSPKKHYFDPDKANSMIPFVYKRLRQHHSGNYEELGSNIIKFQKYPKTVSEIKHWLDVLLSKPELDIDIEAKSLKVTEAGIYTIGMSWSKHEGIAFPVDAIPEQAQEVKQLLKQFFDKYTGIKNVHKANYDVMILVYNLYMNKDITNISGKLEGISKLCNNLDDTLIITYLATNSCSGNSLGLKELAQPFAGDWAVDVSDVTKVDLDKLLQYNLIDCLSTRYVKNIYYPIMQTDEQEEYYETIMLPYLQDNIRMQLTGLPIDLDEVANFKAQLITEQTNLINTLKSCRAVKNAEYCIAETRTINRNKKLKKKVTTVKENLEPINFNSNNQLRILLYEVMQLPVIELTDKKESATGKQVLKNLRNHTKNPEYLQILEALRDLADVEKILSTFIPAFENAHVDKKGNAHLLGYFNSTGTVSGRLSSNSVNLQQLPSTGSRFSKATKKCFKAPKDKLFVGIDFASLEDRISALTTKDPNKLQIYTDGYDGHSFRAYYYFTHLCEDITDQLNKISSTEEKVEVINSIEFIHKDLRQQSKAPTFALTYNGTYLTLMKNCGFDEATAKRIEASFKELYSVSIEWVEKHLKEAAITGYIITGLGLKIRTPLLKKQGYSLDRKGAVAAEARTAGNALGQGWGILNDRAMHEVLENVDRLGLSNSIEPVAKIHDACYYLVDNDVEIIKILNDLCVQATKWQEHPVIQHDKVHLCGQLEVYYPSWAVPLKLPENASIDGIIDLASQHKQTAEEH